jgi:6-phosphogluconolactonase
VRATRSRPLLPFRSPFPHRVISPSFVFSASFHFPSFYSLRLNVVYTCTEDIEESGQILAYEVHNDGSLTEMCRIDAGGTSTCYLTIDREHRHLLAVNYWDSTLVVIPLSRETGEFAGPIQNVYDPKAGKKMIAAAKKNGGVNHSNNDSSTIAMRQVDPHSHALVLDPFEGCVAYVPDLGKDLIREIFYDNRKGVLGCEFNVLPSGMSTGMPDGPRYIDFHPSLNVAYVVNELSSTIAVFSVDRGLLGEISRAEKLGLPMDTFSGRSTLRLIQSIKTVPSAFPITMNTCGRICVHQSGRFVIVSNRGHESITIFRVKQSCGGGGNKGRAVRGTLTQVGFFHTRGETPRHFQFDHSGQFLIVANQDSDTIAVFSFNLTSGEIKYTGHEVINFFHFLFSIKCINDCLMAPLTRNFLCLLCSTASRVRTLSAAVIWLTGTLNTTSRPARRTDTPSSRRSLTITRAAGFPLPSSSHY